MELCGTPGGLEGDITKSGHWRRGGRPYNTVMSNYIFLCQDMNSYIFLYRVMKDSSEVFLTTCA